MGLGFLLCQIERCCTREEDKLGAEAQVGGRYARTAGDPTTAMPSERKFPGVSGPDSDHTIFPTSLCGPKIFRTRQ